MEEKVNEKLTDMYSGTGVTRYYKSQIDPHVGDEGYKAFKSRTIFVAVVFPSRGLPSADTFESVIRQLIRRIRRNNRNRTVVGVYVPANMKEGKKDPVAYLAVLCENSVRLSAIENSLKGVGKAVRVSIGKRDQVPSYVEAAVQLSRAIYPGHDDEFGPFKDGSIDYFPKKRGRKPKKAAARVEHARVSEPTLDDPAFDQIGKPVGNVVQLNDVEAAPSPAMKNIVASRGYEASGL